MVNLWLIIGITIYLVGGDWNHGILNDVPLGISSSQLTNSIIFQRGWLKPPTSLYPLRGKKLKFSRTSQPY
jgi:hypothetical protein